MLFFFSFTQSVGRCDRKHSLQELQSLSRLHYRGQSTILTQTITHLVYPSKNNCITIIFNFSWDDRNTQAKLETMVMQIMVYVKMVNNYRLGWVSLQTLNGGGREVGVKLNNDNERGAKTTKKRTKVKTQKPTPEQKQIKTCSPTEEAH